MKHLRESTALSAIFAVAALVMAFLVPLHAGAQAYLGGDFDDSEIRLLPPYCKCAPSFRGRGGGCANPAEFEHWSARFGEVLGHMHHWCYGLIGMNRARLGTTGPSNKTYRDRMCSAMINEATYVIERSPKDFVLKPEFFTMRGDCKLQLKQLTGGFRDLRAAMDLKPDYWPPYVTLSDFLKDLGDIKQARQILEEALSHSPDSKTVKAKLADLGAMKDKRPGDAEPAPKASAQNAPQKKGAAPETKEPETAPGR